MLATADEHHSRPPLEASREGDSHAEQTGRSHRPGSSPIAVILTDEKPEGASQFKEGSRGCVGATIVAVAGGKTAAFDRRTYGCPGGGVGLGFGNCYEQASFPIEKLLSSGDPQAGGGGPLAEGERFFRTPEIVQEWLGHVPMTEVPTEYVVIRPWSRSRRPRRPRSSPSW